MTEACRRPAIPAADRQFLRQQQNEESAMRIIKTCAAALTIAILAAPAVAFAESCGNDASRFSAWVADFRQEANANGISRQTLDAALSNVRYATRTIHLDRTQKSFKLSFEAFMKKRGADYIISKGRQHKKRHAELFSAIEQRYGVPAGPLIAIWGMETGFGNFIGDQDIFSPLATLAYDCRRADFFQEQLYAALRILDSGQLTKASMVGAGHGEIGQMQFLPANYLRYGVDGDGDGRVDMINSLADAFASTANYLRAYGWQPGLGYQPGEPNFEAIVGWNQASVYQRALAVIGKAIDR
jgi:lytic murein transglycosylase